MLFKMPLSMILLLFVGGLVLILSGFHRGDWIDIAMGLFVALFVIRFFYEEH